MPFFSVVIATRNRPAPFGEALQSVLGQSCSDLEVIVVNDGSAAEHQSSYESLLRMREPSLVRSFDLAPTPRGHGGSYVRNFGVEKATAPYVCFLDDDDCWTDLGHLERAKMIIRDAADEVDLYMSNQTAFLRGVEQPGPRWLGDMPAILTRVGKRPDHNGAYTVMVQDLLKSQGFSHLNTLIVRRTLYQSIGGMDESNPWAHDRDLYLQLIDNAAVMKYAAVTVARHNVPDPTERTTITTSLSTFDRRMSQIRCLDRAILSGRHPELRAYGKRNKGYELKRLTEALVTDGRHVDAAHYAREALRLAPTVKWAAYTIWRTLRALGA